MLWILLELVTTSRGTYEVGDYLVCGGGGGGGGRYHIVLLHSEHVTCKKVTCLFLTSFGHTYTVDQLSHSSQVRFPDDRQLLFPVKQAEVRATGTSETRLDTSVILSHGVWTGECTYIGQVLHA